MRAAAVADGDDRRARYFHYDRCVDIVSVAEVWFTKSTGLRATVVHFERFPRLAHPDGNDATPDFTVLFNDGTALIGELANLALEPTSLDSLAKQLGRYADLKEVPSDPRDEHGHQPTQDVTAVDVLLITPLDVMNPAADKLAALIEDGDHPFNPDPGPTVLGWGYDAASEKYTFVRPDRASNPKIRDHGRSPSLRSWLEEGSDTLSGLPKHFLPIKTSVRFMNDSPPANYTATVLWGFVAAALLAERGEEPPADLDTTVEELVERLRRDYGVGKSSDVRAALEFLSVARLAEKSAHGWTIYYRDLGRIERDLHAALLHEYFNKAKKTRPIRAAKDSAPEPDPAEPEPEPDPLFPLQDGST